MCFVCLSAGQRSSECESTKCEACDRNHHKLLHRWDKPRDTSTANMNPAIHVKNESFGIHDDKASSRSPLSRSYLPVVRSKIMSKNNSTVVTTLLDSGSEVNILSKRVAKSLGLRGETIVINTIGVGGICTQQVTKKVNIVVQDKMGVETIVEAIVLDKTCGDALPVPRDIVENLRRKHNVNAEAIYSKGGEIDLLIGMSSPQLHIRTNKSEECDGLSMIETRFGPCIVGICEYGPEVRLEYENYNTQYIGITHDVDLWHYVEADMAGVSKECPCQIKSDDEIKYEQVMQKAWSRDEFGRFEVKLPWKVAQKLFQITEYRPYIGMSILGNNCQRIPK